MVKTIMICCLTILLSISYSKSENIKAEVKLKDKSAVIPVKIKKEIFGGFMEFVHHWFNSEKGYIAQEIQNRGFDLVSDGQELPNFWYLNVNSDSYTYKLLEGGYNPNGLYSVHLKNDTEGKSVGIMQGIFLTPDTGNDFYVYIKDNASSKVEIRMMDKEMQILQSQTIILEGSDWNKYELEFPYIENQGSCYLGIFAVDNSDIEIDEVSFMPKNRQFSMRKEYYDLYKKWSPGVMRYPGGWYADSKIAHWQDGVGDIDKRKSPSFNFTHSQRLEFGTDEFIAFCKSLDCEPHICANMKEGTPQEAAAWLEYCNGDKETTYGAMRATNGNPEPYNVKYWDIGNEQWEDAEWMANRYVEIWQEMNKVDPNVKYIIGGDLWQGNKFFETTMGIAGDYVDYYSWHLLSGSMEKDIEDSLDVYLTLMGNTIDHEKSYQNFQNLLEKGGFVPKTRQCITELWTAFNHHDWTFHPRLYKLESGLWTALQMNISIRQSVIFDMNERTCNSGMFFAYTDFDTGKRIIAPSPSLWAMALYSNHHGTYNLPLEVEAPTYDAKEIPGTWGTSNVPWIDAASSISEDTLFLHIVNRHPHKSAEIDIDLNEFSVTQKMTCYSLKSDHFLDGPSVELPDKVTPVTEVKDYSSTVLVPKHSLLILAIPVENGIGVEESHNQSNDMISAYPNPFNSYLNITLKDGKVLAGSTIQFIDLKGNVIEEGKVGSEKEIIFLAKNIPSGEYIIRLINGDKEYTQKVVKVK